MAPCRSRAIPWHKEAAFRLPVALWRDMMERYYPNGAWLCLHRDVFDRLARFQTRARFHELGGRHVARCAADSTNMSQCNRTCNRTIRMNAVESVVQAVLYEGYMLYPYRPSSVKNRQRWTFGGVFPRAYVEASGSDVSAMQRECVVDGSADTRFAVRPGCLQLIRRDVRQVIDPRGARPEVCEPPSRPVASMEVGGRRFDAWQEASETQLDFAPATLGELCTTGQRMPFSLDGSRQTESLRDANELVCGVLLRTREVIDGRLECCAVRVADHVFRVTVRIVNATRVEAPKTLSRDDASLFSLVSCHAVLGVEEGEFVSSMAPPDELAAEAAACRNAGLWPVLVGEEPAPDTMLASPIILYDYPIVAPESAGDLFDSTEIDEILTLRILTMTDDEKREMVAADEHARALLARTERLSVDEMQKLHGTLRHVRADPVGTAPMSAHPMQRATAAIAAGSRSTRPIFATRGPNSMPGRAWLRACRRRGIHGRRSGAFAPACTCRHLRYCAARHSGDDRIDRTRSRRSCACGRDHRRRSWQGLRHRAHAGTSFLLRARRNRTATVKERRR